MFVGLGLLLGVLGRLSIPGLQEDVVDHIPVLLEGDLQLLLLILPGDGGHHNCLTLLVADLLMFALQGDAAHLCLLGLLLAGGSLHLGLLLDIDEGLPDTRTHQSVVTLPHPLVAGTLLFHPNVILTRRLDDVLIFHLLDGALLLDE